MKDITLPVGTIDQLHELRQQLQNRIDAIDILLNEFHGVAAVALGEAEPAPLGEGEEPEEEPVRARLGSKRLFRAAVAVVGKVLAEAGEPLHVAKVQRLLSRELGQRVKRATTARALRMLREQGLATTTSTRLRSGKPGGGIGSKWRLLSQAERNGAGA